MTKTRLILTIVLLLTIFGVKAQKIELSTGIGFLTDLEYLNRDKGTINSDGEEFSKLKFLRFAYRFAPRWQAYVGGSWQSGRTNNYELVDRTFYWDYFSWQIDAGMNFHYVKEKRFNLYSGLGLALVNTDYTAEGGASGELTPPTESSMVNLHVRLLGFDYTIIDGFKAFTEVGFGADGMFRIGVKAFPPKK